MSNYDYKLRRQRGHHHDIRPIKAIDTHFSDSEDDSNETDHNTQDFNDVFTQFLIENEGSNDL